MLEIDRLTVNFHTPSGEVRAVDNVSLKLKEKETLALVGETGCGKSTLGRSILGLSSENTVTTGSVFFKGLDLLTLGEKQLAAVRGNAISIIPQSPEAALNPVLNIESQLLEQLRVHRGKKFNRRQARQEISVVLKKLGFQDAAALLKQYPFQLSGGMAQRVVIAAAVLNDPGIIIADEPTRALDRELRRSVIEELTAVKKMERASMLLITHDLELAAAFSDRIAVMYTGEIVEIRDSKNFFKKRTASLPYEGLAAGLPGQLDPKVCFISKGSRSINEKPLHPYSQMLVDSLPGKGFRPPAAAVSTGAAPVEGCKFRPRCPFKRDACAVGRPGLIPIQGGEVRCLLYS